jgi:membrane-bound serine protease (ClpP class)
MDAVLDAPAVVLVAVALAAVLFLLEVALPTVGIAGGSGVVLALLAAWAVDRQDATWWPLAGVAAAVVLWGVLIAMHRAPFAAQVAAATLFAGSGMVFAALNSDAAAFGPAVVTGVGLPAVFPLIARSANRLEALPPQVGMHAMVGRRAEVVDWSGNTGHVRVDGSLWNARGAVAHTPGETVTITGVDGLAVVVDRRTMPPWLEPSSASSSS